jgi:hypothetical protein
MATIVITLYKPELATIRTNNHHSDDMTAPFTTSPLDTYRGGHCSQKSAVTVRDEPKKNKKIAKSG